MLLQTGDVCDTNVVEADRLLAFALHLGGLGAIDPCIEFLKTVSTATQAGCLLYYLTAFVVERGQVNVEHQTSKIELRSETTNGERRTATSSTSRVVAFRRSLQRSTLDV
jgi:hypothetical protein